MAIEPTLPHSAMPLPYFEDEVISIFKRKKIPLQLRSNFDELRTGGLLISKDILLTVTSIKARVLLTYGSNYINLKNTYPEISLDLLLSYPESVLDAIGLYSDELDLFIQAGYAFPWLQLEKYNVELVETIVRNSRECIQLKKIYPELSWEKLITLDSAAIGKLRVLTLYDFKTIRDSGIEFTLEQFIALTQDKKDIISGICDELILFKQAGVEISWEQIITLDRYKQERLKNYAKQLNEFQIAGIVLTWDLLTSLRTIKIPSKKLY